MLGSGLRESEVGGARRVDAHVEHSRSHRPSLSSETYVGRSGDRPGLRVSRTWLGTTAILIVVALAMQGVLFSQCGEGPAQMAAGTALIQDDEAPVADAGGNITACPGIEVELDGSNSTDNVGIVSYDWTLWLDPVVNLTGETVTYEFTSEGVYEVTLNVTDLEGNWDLDSIFVTVMADSTLPIPSLGYVPSAYTGSVVILNATRSSDPETGIANYTWNFTYESQPVVLYGPVVEFEFLVPGRYVITLNVTNGVGLSNSTSAVVNIRDAPTWLSENWVFLSMTGFAMVVVAWWMLRRYRDNRTLITETEREKLRLLMARLKEVTRLVVSNPMGLAGVLILVFFIVLTFFGPEIAPYDTSNLGLGNWMLPSDFATDAPPSFVYFSLLIPGIVGLFVSGFAFVASFVRVTDWKLNKSMQAAALATSALLVVLATHGNAVNASFMEGQTWWLLILSPTAMSLVIASLGTRSRVISKRKRARAVGLVASLLPLPILALPALVDMGSFKLPLFYLGAYTISGFSYAIAGACFVSAYKRPPTVEVRLASEGKKLESPMFTRIPSLAKTLSSVAAFAAVFTGVMIYMAGNWTTHWMGTDTFGADILSELLYGARTSMIVGIFSALIASVLGALVGLYSGYVGGWVDEVIMRANDVVLSIPWLVLMIIVAAMIGKIDLLGLILIIGFTGWSPTARMVRAQVLSIRERQYIERARAIGSSDLGIIKRHILPNSFPLVFANTILTVAVSILSEATLSFLGMRPIGVVTWGTMLDYAADANAFAIGLHWWIIAPGLCIVAVVLGFTLLGYALDDILNPKLRKR